MKTIYAFAFVTLCTVPAAAQDKNEYFESWNACGVGTTIEIETKSTMMNQTMTSVLEKKEEKVITLKCTSVTKMEGIEDQTSTMPLKIEKDLPKGPGTWECPMCKKKHKSEASKPTTEKVKVGDKELECTVVETTSYDCDGKENSKTKSWSCKDVPGMLVKNHSKGSMMGQEYETTMTLTKFEKK